VRAGLDTKQFRPHGRQFQLSVRSISLLTCFR